MDIPIALGKPITTTEPSHQQEDPPEGQTEESDNSWIERTLVGVFHELDGAKIHDSQTEEVRRWLNDNIRAGHEQMTQRMKDSIGGLTFWRYKSWILVADRDEDRPTTENERLYKGTLTMMEDASLFPTEEPIQEVEEWIGSALFRRTLSMRN